MVVKKWLTHLVITGYIGALAWGLVSHTFEYKNDSHPAMYYIVWDMFCGWGSYSNRVQVIAEGESGNSTKSHRLRGDQSNRSENSTVVTTISTGWQSIGLP